jgi:hypothetical protein
MLKTLLLLLLMLRLLLHCACSMAWYIRQAAEPSDCTKINPMLLLLLLLVMLIHPRS